MRSSVQHKRRLHLASQESDKGDPCGQAKAGACVNMYRYINIIIREAVSRSDTLIAQWLWCIKATLYCQKPFFNISFLSPPPRSAFAMHNTWFGRFYQTVLFLLQSLLPFCKCLSIAAIILAPSVRRRAEPIIQNVKMLKSIAPEARAESPLNKISVSASCCIMLQEEQTMVQNSRRHETHVQTPCRTCFRTGAYFREFTFPMCMT